MIIKNKKIIFLSCIFLLKICGFANSSKTPSELFGMGLEEQNLENWYLASQYFMEAVQKNPVYKDAWLHLAQCTYHIGEYELVLNQLEEAEKYARDDEIIGNLRGMTLISLGRLSEAHDVFKKILKKSPNNIDARFGLAELDLFDGRISGAEKQYEEALKRQNENRKALLSLAVVSAELGKKDAAYRYISQALKYYSESAEVHYTAAVINSMHGDIAAAEKQCRTALEVNGNYSKAYEFLAKLRYAQGAYDDVISICDFRLGRSSKNFSAWYLKGCAQSAKGNALDAIETWSTGLRIIPEDEVMRAALELTVKQNLPIEDPRRNIWADYHVSAAKEYLRRYDSAGSGYEYRRALKMQPSNEEARKAFAEMLKQNGMHELYLEQLLFLKKNASYSENEKQKKSIPLIKTDDTIEAYKDLLKDSLAKKWNVEPFYLDKTRWRIGIYYMPSPVHHFHAESNKVAAEFASDIFSGVAGTSVNTFAQPVKGFGEAYQKARTGNTDYFIMISIDKTLEDVNLDYAMYSARTGAKVLESSLYSTGNHSFSNVFRRFRADILEHLPIRAKILERNGKTVLADIGRAENITDGAVFDIVKKDCIQTASSGNGVSYKKSDVLGIFTITHAGEDISEGIVEYNGFYDRINKNDEIILVSMPEKSKEPSAVNETAPAALPNGTAAVKNKDFKLTAEDLGFKRIPSFIKLIRSI